MPTVELSDAAYRAALQGSAAGGFARVDGYVDEMALQGVAPAPVGFDPLFTPERMAQIAEGEADVAAGRVLTPAEVRAELAKLQAGWAAPR